ncbi:MAG: glycosyltransferase [Flavobacteriia bacterium]|nr:glycosyltransferase [Flavobacteriia bacterium]
MITLLTTLLFCCSGALIALLLAYPVFSYLRSVISPDPVKKDPAFQPPVSIIIACYNEERYLHEKLETLLAPHEWIEGSEIIVVSTGSTDKSNSILQSFAHRPEVTILFEDRITKIEALNKAVPLARHDYLVFSDCRQYMKPGSVKELISNLNDERVGTVTCTILDTRERPTFFRRLYLFLAKCDSKASSTFNLYGALYAQRRDTFRPIPDHLLFDDFFVAISTLSQQKRLVQEENAVLFDIPFPHYYHRERIERLARGLLIFFFNNYALIGQIPLKTRIRLLIYKYLKLLLPFLALTFGLTSLFLFQETLISVTTLFVITMLLLLVFTSKNVTQHCLLILKINLYFFNALWGYAFLNRRSKHWKPLTIRRKWYRLGLEQTTQKK